MGPGVAAIEGIGAAVGGSAAVAGAEVAGVAAGQVAAATAEGALGIAPKVVEAGVDSASTALSEAADAAANSLASGAETALQIGGPDAALKTLAGVSAETQLDTSSVSQPLTAAEMSANMDLLLAAKAISPAESTDAAKLTNWINKDRGDQKPHSEVGAASSPVVETPEAKPDTVLKGTDTTNPASPQTEGAVEPDGQQVAEVPADAASTTPAVKTETVTPPNPEPAAQLVVPQEDLTKDVKAQTIEEAKAPNLEVIELQRQIQELGEQVAKQGKLIKEMLKAMDEEDPKKKKNMIMELIKLAAVILVGETVEAAKK